jgi:hypothetical protein
MARRHSLLFGQLLLLCSSAVLGQDWKLGRATYFGAPFDFGKAFDPFRGKGSFGILKHGSCGFTDLMPNGDTYLPFERDAVAASADTNPDYPGSCGRCYAMRCKEGLVQSECTVCGDHIQTAAGYADCQPVHVGHVDSQDAPALVHMCVC